MNAILIRKLVISGGLVALLVYLELRKKKPATAEGRIEAFVECDPMDPLYNTAACRSSASTGGYWDAADANESDGESDAALGFNNLVHLFDDL